VTILHSIIIADRLVKIVVTLV